MGERRQDAELPADHDEHFRSSRRRSPSRYSGRYAGYPFVRFYGIWNESNLGLFLSPQFNSSGQDRRPAAYAKLAAAGVRGHQGRQREGARRDRRDVVARPRQAARGQLGHGLAGHVRRSCVAKANPRLKFDAWAHHPYPYPSNQKPTQKVKWPNVVAQLAAAVRDVDRLVVPPQEHPGLDHRVRPRDEARRAAGVTEAQQAAYFPQAIAIAKKDPRVPMFMWFVFRDSTGSPWQSGLYRKTGGPKPAQPKFASAAGPLNPVNAKLSVKGGTKNPSVTVYLRSFCVNSPIGAPVGVDSASVARRQGRRGLAGAAEPRDRLHRRFSPHRPDRRQGEDLHGHGGCEHQERRQPDSQDHDRRH